MRRLCRVEMGNLQGWFDLLIIGSVLTNEAYSTLLRRRFKTTRSSSISYYRRPKISRRSRQKEFEPVP